MTRFAKAAACTFGAAAAFAASSFAAQAGGLAPAPSEPVVAAPAPIAAPASALRFSGFYAGASVGYAFEGNDTVGVRTATTVTDHGTLTNEGAFGAIHAGYRMQRNQFVFGAEIGAEGGDVDSAVSEGGVASTTAINDMLTVKGTLGMALRDNILVYGTGGYASAGVDYSVQGDDVAIDTNFRRDGYVLGAGVEYAFGQAWSVRGEYQYANFRSIDLSDDAGVSTRATPEFHSVRVGVNFSF